MQQDFLLLISCMHDVVFHEPPRSPCRLALAICESLAMSSTSQLGVSALAGNDEDEPGFHNGASESRERRENGVAEKNVVVQGKKKEKRHPRPHRRKQYVSGPPSKPPRHSNESVRPSIVAKGDQMRKQTFANAPKQTTIPEMHFPSETFSVRGREATL